MIKTIETLLNKVKHSKNPNDAVSFLFHHIQSKESFCKECKPLSDSETNALLELLKPVLKNRFDDYTKPTLFCPMRYKNTQLIHGLMIVSNFVYTLIYFENDLVGQLTGTNQSFGKSVETLRLRGVINHEKLGPPVVVRVARND